MFFLVIKVQSIDDHIIVKNGIQTQFILHPLFAEQIEKNIRNFMNGKMISNLKVVK